MEADKHALIEEFAPAYDMVERHQTDVHAPVERVYEPVRNLELTGSRTFRWLFLLRELPASLRFAGRGSGRLGLTLDALLRSGFILLGEKPQQEILLGLVGRFWAPSGCIQWLDADDFRCFSRSGYAKAIWNFTFLNEIMERRVSPQRRGYSVWTTRAGGVFVCTGCLSGRLAV